MDLPTSKESSSRSARPGPCRLRGLGNRGSLGTDTHLRGEQANPHHQASYTGRIDTVTLELPAGVGSGEVALTGADGNRIRSRAITDEPGGLAKNTAVYIAAVDSEYVRNHVKVPPKEVAVFTGYGRGGAGDPQDGLGTLVGVSLQPVAKVIESLMLS